MLELPAGKFSIFSWLKAKTNAPTTFAIGVICGLVVGYVIFSNNLVLAPDNNSEEFKTKNVVNEVVSSGKEPDQKEYSLLINRQLPGTVVVADQARVKESGWLTVHTDNGGDIGPIILGAAYLKTGQDGKIELSLLKGVVDGNEYWLVLHDDDGDHIFDHELDLPRRDNRGNIEATKFSVTALSSRGD